MAKTFAGDEAPLEMIVPPSQRTKRINLLDATDIAARFDRPIFTDNERVEYLAYSHLLSE